MFWFDFDLGFSGFSLKNRLKPLVFLMPVFAWFCLLGWGCASARMSDTVSTTYFREANYTEAQKKLEAGFKDHGEDGKDAVLYLLDLALAHRYQKHFEESNQYLHRADKIAESLDYRHLGEEAVTLFTSDNIKYYRTEDFEWVLISVFLAMNYAEMGKLEDALVEVRRVNRKLYMVSQNGEKEYKQNPFARYLSGVFYEAEGNWNDAYIDYKESYRLTSSGASVGANTNVDETKVSVSNEIPNIGLDLLRLSILQKDKEDQKKWTEEFKIGAEARDKLISDLKAKREGKLGEVVLFYENGISPEKKPHPNFYQIPKFYPRQNPVAVAKVEIFHNGVSIGQYQTEMLNDIEKTAVENLDEKYAGIIAKKVGGIIAKEVVSDQIGKASGSQELGLAAKLFFYLTDQADVRSWLLLPRDLQLLRVQLPPGKYQMHVKPVGAESKSGQMEFEVKGSETIFRHFRYMP